MFALQFNTMHSLQPAAAAHEVGHALGLLHEHQRPDRDQYVKVHYDLIHDIRHGQVFKHGSYGSLTYGLPYDYGSIMHYTSTVCM